MFVIKFQEHYKLLSLNSLIRPMRNCFAIKLSYNNINEVVLHKWQGIHAQRTC